MKIIAHIGDHRVMVEMSRDELANVTGHDTQNGLPGYYDRGGAFKIGWEYDVSHAWRRLREQEKVKQDLEIAAQSLESIAKLIRYEAPRCTPPAEATKEGGAS